MNREQAINKIAKLLMRLSSELTLIEGANPNDLWPLHPDIVAPESYLGAKSTMNEIFEIVRKQNGEMLSDEIILSRLLYSVAALRLQMPLLSDHELEDKAIEATTRLIDYRASRNVDIPLIFLDIGEEPFHFGPITFIQISNSDKETKWWEWARATVGTSANSYLLSYAQVNVPGDRSTARIYANRIIQEGLSIFRGICFPITAQEIHQFGIINDYPLWKNLPYRLGKPEETTIIDIRSDLSMETGPARFSYRLHEDLLSNIDEDIFSTFLKIIGSIGFCPQQEMQRKLISGLRWLGEATKPDILTARFAKLAFSLETFIGGESSNDYLTSKGITAMLSERAAFLLGDTPELKKKYDHEIRDFYNKRSEIAHGKVSSITSDDFEKFGQLVREIGWSLIKMNNQFLTIEAFQKWVMDQRYD